MSVRKSIQLLATQEKPRISLGMSSLLELQGRVFCSLELKLSGLNKTGKLFFPPFMFYVLLTVFNECTLNILLL